MSTAWGHSESETFGRGSAQSQTRGESAGESATRGASEAYVTEYAPMPSALYTLEEQIARVQGQLQSLPAREVMVRLHGATPLRLRTPEMPNAFKSDAYRALLVPRYLALIARRNPYLISIADADAERVQRIATALAPTPAEAPETPEPFDFVDDPEAFAREFWRRRTRPKSPKSPLRIVKPDGDNDA